MEQPLRGKNICITGKLNCPRVEATAALKRLGANVQSTVTMSTDMVLVGERVGATKMNKVRRYGIKTLTEDDLDRMLGV